LLGPEFLEVKAASLFLNSWFLEVVAFI
jgi:hypothetical protein